VELGLPAKFLQAAQQRTYWSGIFSGYRRLPLDEPLLNGAIRIRRPLNESDIAKGLSSLWGSALRLARRIDFFAAASGTSATCSASVGSSAMPSKAEVSGNRYQAYSRPS
jgi:hypothetical protein